MGYAPGFAWVKYNQVSISIQVTCNKRESHNICLSIQVTCKSKNPRNSLP
jgi:hypothetical protein